MNLRNKNLSVGIWSEEHEKLANWYEKVLGFKIKNRSELPNDMCIDLEMGDNFFFIGKHNGVKGKNSDKYRHMVGFSVESVGEEYQNLVKHGVKIIAPPFELPTGGPIHCCTFEDPEGNILQIFGKK
jgi:predicted enzyme related to lactoylglutathione lyase